MKKFTVRMSRGVIKTLNKMDKPTRVLLFTWIKTNLDGCTDPRAYGKALSGNLKGAWRYRVGDYRIIAEIGDEELVILVVAVGHRREVYK
jgi:mRNA interferase RelE/StbE